jgi:hypothetical protein
VADVRQSYWRTTDAEADAGLQQAVDEAVDTPPDAVADLDEGADQDLTQEQAEEYWVPEAHRILTRVATTYQALIEYGELAAEVQESTGVFTRRQVRSWIGPVLAQVAHRNHENDEPPLTSLVVHKSDGSVGAGYDEVLRLSGDAEISDPVQREKHAARARLECYGWAGAKLPAGGGRPALSPRWEQIQGRLRKERRAAEQPNICPTCFMAIPPTGVCDNCG